MFTSAAVASSYAVASSLLAASPEYCVFVALSPVFVPVLDPLPDGYRVSKYVFRNTLRFVNERNFITLLAALSIIGTQSAFTGVVFHVREASKRVVTQSYIALAVRYKVLLDVLPVIVVALFTTSSGTYAILELRIFQFPAVCPGVSTLAMIESPTCTAVPHSVPITDMIYISPFTTAPAVHDHPVVGNVFGEASYPPR